MSSTVSLADHLGSRGHRTRRGVRLLGLILVPVLAASLSDVASPPAAVAGPPGKWTKLSTGTVVDVTPALFRAKNGILHVVYSRRATPGHLSYGHTAVRANGAVVSRHTPINNWRNLGVPKLIPGPNGGMRLVFSAQRSTITGDYYNDRVYSTRANRHGANWTLEGAFGSGYFAADPGAVTLSNGVPLAAFAKAGGVSPISWHPGINDGPVSRSFDVSGFVHHVDAARQGGNVYLSWSTYGDEPDGTFVRRILPSYGPILEAPRSGHLDGPSAIVARRRGGIYLLYCTGAVSCGSLALWRMGAPRAVIVRSSKGARGPLSISAAPNGRLWIAWIGGDHKVRAVRTGTNGRTFGAVRVLPHGPWRGMTPDKVAIDGSRGSAELVTVANGSAWHQRVLPGLTVRANPQRWSARTRQTVRFTVLDANAPVRRAKVTALSRSCVTNATGKCRITFPRLGARRFKAWARKAGYHPAFVRLRIG